MRQELERDRYLEDSELEALLRATRERRHQNAPRDLAMFATLSTTGIRPGELVTLRVKDLHLAEREAWIRIRRLKTRQPGGRLADIPISRTLARTLRGYVRAAGLTVRRGVIEGEQLEARVFPIGVRNLEILFRRYAALAKLSSVYTLYALRHTALTRALRATGDLRLVQDMAGHASPQTTAIYAHVSPQKKRATAEALGAVLGG